MKGQGRHVEADTQSYAARHLHIKTEMARKKIGADPSVKIGSQQNCKKPSSKRDTCKRCQSSSARKYSPTAMTIIGCRISLILPRHRYSADSARRAVPKARVQQPTNTGDLVGKIFCKGPNGLFFMINHLWTRPALRYSLENRQCQGSPHSRESRLTRSTCPQNSRLIIDSDRLQYRHAIHLEAAIHQHL